MKQIVRMDAKGLDWLEAFKQAYAARRANALDCGRIAFAGRCRLAYGEFSRKADSGELPLAKRTLGMWTLIGGELGDLDANGNPEAASRDAKCTAQIVSILANSRAQVDTDYTSQLPSTFKSLYWLARLGRKLVLDLLSQSSAHIHPGLKEKEAQALFRKHNAEEAGSPGRWTVKRRLAKIENFVATLELDGNGDEIALALRKFKSLAKRLEQRQLSLTVINASSQQFGMAAA
jgi:hypothetical protein